MGTLAGLLTAEAIGGAAVGVGAGIAAGTALKQPKIPSLPAPKLTQEVKSAELLTATEQVEEQTKKSTRKKSGFRETIVAGALVPETDKKTLLG